MNDEDYRRVGPPAAGGLAIARGLSGMYAALHHDLGGGRLLSDDTIAQVSQQQVNGINLTSGMPLAFGVVFMKPCPPRLEFGGFRAFGHDGLGGSLAFSDPHHDVTLGYIVKRIPLPGGAAERSVDLTKVLRSCLA